jgi:uncharacterized membrane protein
MLMTALLTLVLIALAALGVWFVVRAVSGRRR